MLLAGRHALRPATASATPAPTPAPPRAEDARYAWAAKVPTAKLQDEKKDLEQRAEALRTFLSTRVLWTAHARDMAARLGPAIVLTSFQGAAELEGGKGKAKQSLALKLSAPIKKAGAMPEEIDGFLRTLRDDPLLKRDFPEIEMGDLRWTSAGSGPAAGDVQRDVPARGPGRPRRSPSPPRRRRSNDPEDRTMDAGRLGPLLKDLRKRLKDPLQLRFILGGALALAWYAGVYLPASAGIEEATRAKAASTAHAAVAREIQGLRAEVGEVPRPPAARDRPERVGRVRPRRPPRPARPPAQARAQGPAEARAVPRRHPPDRAGRQVRRPRRRARLDRGQPAALPRRLRRARQGPRQRTAT